MKPDKQSDPRAYGLCRACRQWLKGIEKPGYPMVSSVNIILGDIFPDVIHVAVGIIAQDILHHTLAFRRCSDLRFSRAREFAGDTC
jgi:hypothetical protein